MEPGRGADPPPPGVGRAQGAGHLVWRLGARLQRWSRRNRLVATVGAASLIVGLAVGFGSFALQSHFATLFQAGDRLSGWENFLRVGTPWQSLVPVALAALLAAWGAFRIGSTQPEPPISLGAAEGGTTGQLREALRSERRAVRVALVVVSGLVGVVAVRFSVYSALALSGSQLARATWPGIALELAFWLGAWLAFWNWNRCHRDRMADWGVIER